MKKIDGDLYLCEKSHRGVLNWNIHCLFVSKEKRVWENRRSFIFAESTLFKSCSLRGKDCISSLTKAIVKVNEHKPVNYLSCANCGSNLMEETEKRTQIGQIEEF